MPHTPNRDGSPSSRTPLSKPLNEAPHDASAELIEFPETDPTRWPRRASTAHTRKPIGSAGPSAAFGAALHYLEAGVALIREQDWERSYELAYELHHPRSRSVELWDALLDAGKPMGIRPHGLDALELLRLEKGHIYIGQDTMPDSTPAKLGMDWAVASSKPAFLGKRALERMAERPIERRLVGIAFERGSPAPEICGAPRHGPRRTWRRWDS